MKRRRRIRSPHPGVVLKRRQLPSGSEGWRARYQDPDTGREVYLTLDLVALPTQEARRLWAIRKARALAKRSMDLEAGAPKADVQPLVDALAAYMREAKHRLRPGAITTYRQALGQFEGWAEREGIRTTADITRPALAGLRKRLIAQPRKSAKRGAKRGARKETARRRSPVSVNRELRTIKTLLNAWRVEGLLPHVDRDAITDALEAQPVSHEQPAFLSPTAIDKLLRAALRHDADTFEATREEHAGLRPKGGTHRYDPIAPFTAFLLLTGCRRGEALGLSWADVDLDAVDAQGRAVGEIRLRAEHTKTHRARTIGLEVSPALRAMLAAMKLRAGKGATYVFELRPDRNGKRLPYTADLVEAARQRLMRPGNKDKDGYGAPDFDWQTLRSTCATYLTNAPGIFGAATVFMSAKQLGHSVAIAERHYLGVHRGIPKDAHTLEAAMQIDGAMRDVASIVHGAPLALLVVNR